MPLPQPPEGNLTLYHYTYSEFTEAAQPSVPFCAPPPPDCTLEITAVTHTDVTLRGDADGTITATASGVTGTTYWYANGVSGGTGASYTFSGLSAGYYTIKAVDGDCFWQWDAQIQVLDGEFRTGDFIVTAPTGLTVSENPIILNLQTAYNTGAPAYSEFEIDVDGTVTDGDYLKFTFTYPQAYTAYFYAKSFPNRDTYFLASTLKDAQGVSKGTNSDVEIATSIGEVLAKDSVINRLYWIRTSGSIVYLKAKEANEKLDQVNVLTESSANLDLTQTVNGNAPYDGQITENYSLYTDILVNETAEYGSNPTIDTFNKVAQIELPFNSKTNRHLFDTSDVLKNFVSTPKIDFTLSAYTTIASMMCAYKLQYGEKYPLVENSTTKKSRYKGETDTQFVYNGALPWESDNNIDSYLGTPLHNVKPNFDGTLEGDGAGGIDITINDYLIDTGSTITTDIKFRFTEINTSYDSGWITSSADTVTVSYYGEGRVYISGITSGSTFVFDRYWWGFESVGYATGWYSGYDVAPTNDILFLTNAPNPKFVQRDSSEFLYIILPADYGADLKIKADLYFYDGTELTGETLYTVATGGTNYGGVFMFAAGYNELGLASYETYSGGTRKIRKVEFALYQDDGVNADFLLSEERAYRYEIDEQPRRYGVAFLNKWGTYDIFDFSGEIIDSVTHESQTYEVPRGINTRGSSPKGFQANTVYNTKITKTIAANTGWIDEDHFDWLLELIETNRCYNYTETDQSFLTIESMEYSKSSNDDLYNIDVTFIETLYQNNISV